LRLLRLLLLLCFLRRLRLRGLFLDADNFDVTFLEAVLPLVILFSQREGSCVDKGGIAGCAGGFDSAIDRSNVAYRARRGEVKSQKGVNIVLDRRCNEFNIGDRLIETDIIMYLRLCASTAIRGGIGRKGLPQQQLLDPANKSFFRELERLTLVRGRDGRYLGPGGDANHRILYGTRKLFRHLRGVGAFTDEKRLAVPLKELEPKLPVGLTVEPRPEQISQQGDTTRVLPCRLMPCQQELKLGIDFDAINAVVAVEGLREDDALLRAEPKGVIPLRDEPFEGLLADALDNDPVAVEAPNALLYVVPVKAAVEGVRDESVVMTTDLLSEEVISLLRTAFQAPVYTQKGVKASLDTLGYFIVVLLYHP
jgi:hypothetical protein